MGGTEAEFPALSILKVEHNAFTGRVAGPAAATLPEIGRLQLRQQGFQGASCIHLLAHDGGDLLQHTPKQRQVGVDPRPQSANVTGPQQQLVGGDFSFGRIIAQRHQHQAGDSHDPGITNRRIEFTTPPDGVDAKVSPITEPSKNLC